MKLAALCLLAACGGGPAAIPVGERLGPALGAAFAAADRLRTPWRCAAPDGPNLADETVAGWRLSAHTLHKDGSGDVVIAAVADAGGAAPATIAALARLRTKLAKVDLVLALGGMGETEPELEATLGTLADKAPYPVVALPGDLESETALTGAIAALRAKGALVIDGRLAQRIELPGATIATVAGGGAASRLVAGGDGCAYRAEDVPPALAELTARTGLRILATAEAPRITIDGEPAGELALTAGAGEPGLTPAGERRRAEIDIALHGPVEVAATRARTGTRDGEATPLSPGTSDATARLPGPAHAPSAGLLSVHGDAWSWKPIADGE